MSAQPSQAAGSLADQTISEADCDAMRLLQKELSYLALAVCFAPLPLSFDEEEDRRRDVFYNKVDARFGKLTTELERLHSSCHGSPEFRALVKYVRATSAGLLKVHDHREGLVDLTVTRGLANLDRSKPPELGQQDISNLWSMLLVERTAPVAEGAGSHEGDQSNDDDEYYPATVQFLPPGAIALYRGWEKDFEDAAAEIDVHRTAEQIAAEPLFAPLFDSMSREKQSFTDDLGTKYTIEPGTMRDDGSLPPDHTALGMDNHTLQGYNELLARWEEAAVPPGHELEFWKVTTQVPKKKGQASGAGHVIGPI